MNVNATSIDVNTKLARKANRASVCNTMSGVITGPNGGITASK